MAVNALLTDRNKTFNPSRKRNTFAPLAVTIGLCFGIYWLVARAAAMGWSLESFHWLGQY